MSDEKCEFCNGCGTFDIALPADMGNHTTKECYYCKGSGEDNSDNIHCEHCGLFWNELKIARGYTIHRENCPDCGGEWVVKQMEDV